MKISDLCTHVTSGGTPSRKINEYYENGDIPWLKTGDIKKNFIFETEEFITRKGLENSSAKIIPRNSVIIAMYGDGNTAGNVAINKIDVSTNQACCNLTINPKKANYLYIYYYLKANYKNLVNLKLGGSQQNLNATSIKNFPICTPSLKTQNKISDFLYSIDLLVQNNKKQITILEEASKEIFREWFIRYRFPNWNNFSFKKGTPSSWKLLPFSELVTINPRESLTRDKKNKYVGMETLSTTSMHFVISEERKSTAGSKFRNGDTLFPRITPCLENGKRGFVMTLEEDEVAIGSTEFIVMREKILTPEYTYLMSCFEPFRTHAEQSMVGASGRQRVAENCFSFFLIPTPPKEILEEFTKIVRPMFRQIKNLCEQNTILEQTRDQLLPRLLSGKLSVENLDIQFPPGIREADDT